MRHNMKLSNKIMKKNKNITVTQLRHSSNENYEKPQS
jgi:hypothetical protein